MSNTRTKPTRIYNALGPALAIYRDRPLRWRDFFLVFIPGAMMVCMPLIYGLNRWYYAHTRYGPIAAKNWSWPWFALSAVALIPLLLLALRRVRQAHRVVLLHKFGITIRWTNGRHYSLRWEDISGIACTITEKRFFGIPLRTRYLLMIYNHTTQPLRVDDRIQKIPDLIARIKAKVYPRLLRQMRAALQEGETLSFGVVSVHQRGILLYRSEIPWAQVTRLDIRSGKLVVESHITRTKKIPVGKIRNVELLIQLLQEGVIS